MLIEWLKSKQQAEGISNAEFARKLGISRSYWTMFKNGDRVRPTYLLLQSAIRAYPDDHDRLLSFLARAVTNETDEDTIMTAAS